MNAPVSLSKPEIKLAVFLYFFVYKMKSTRVVFASGEPAGGAYSGASSAGGGLFGSFSSPDFN